MNNSASAKKSKAMQDTSRPMQDTSRPRRRTTDVRLDKSTTGRNFERLPALQAVTYAPSRDTLDPYGLHNSTPSAKECMYNGRKDAFDLSSNSVTMRKSGQVVNNLGDRLEWIRSDRGLCFTAPKHRSVIMKTHSDHV